MLKNFSDANPKPEKGPEKEEPSIAQELLEAIRLATQEYKSFEVILNLQAAEKFLKNCRYTYKPFRKGILLSFEKANIYIHDPEK
jgi:hypothetical protein